MNPRRPGQFLEEQIQRKAMIAGVCIAFAWGLAALGLEWWPVALAVIPVVFVVDRQGRNGGRLDASRQLVGLEGERRAGAVLEELAARGVLAVHDLNVGRGNVDHIAISAQGVFAIEVKHLSGGRFHLRRGIGLMQGSRPADGHAAQARRNATAVHELLLRSGIDLWVQPMLLSTKAEVWKGGFRIGPVHVLAPEALPDALTSGPEQLDDQQRRRIYQVLLAGDVAASA
jgi:Nuclease-related domain